MSKKRRLTDPEKKRIHDRQMAEEQHSFPYYKIEITVWDETDDDGNPRLTILKQKEPIMPPGWEPQ